ncbi:MAG: glycosyltransferase family 39 protein [Candidatus Omnitrophica bacterium]|nr:glycosyltransferase family 39 protein [Candidatus Omnitrophota bacterium]
MKKELFLISALILFIVLSGLFYCASNSITSDEKTHMTAGYINIRFNDYRFNIEHPPFIKQVSAIPLLFLNIKFPHEVYAASSINSDIVKMQKPFLFKLGNDLNLMLFLSRLISVLICAILGIFIYLYSRRLNGILGGIISLACFAFCPNFLAHAPLVTFDAAISCFYFMTIYFFMRYSESGRGWHLYATGAFLGIALITKYSSLVLIPVIYALVFFTVFMLRKNFVDYNYKLNIKHLIFGIPIFIAVIAYKQSFKIVFPAALIYAASMLFNKNTTLKKQFMLAGKMLLVILAAGFLIVILDYTNYSWFPLHSPTKAYFKGLAYFLGHARQGHMAYLMGNYSKDGWWYYFPLAMLFKTPVAAIILITAGFFGIFAKKEKFPQVVFLLLPLLAYLFTSCFVNKVNIGIRHILPIYPFLYVIAGGCVNIKGTFAGQKAVSAIIAVLVILLAVDTISAYPRHLSYFNNVSGGFKNGYKLLGDSNIAWGQDYKRLKEYIEKNNIKEVKIKAFFGGENAYQYYKIPYAAFSKTDYINPRKGDYILENTELQSGQVKWAPSSKPVSWIGGSLLHYKKE